ncbi:MAG: flagellar motor protein MotB [Acidobacteriota bacterium]
MEKGQVIIIRKKSGGHGGHHGGAWKVAYADFVTAMMAFFLVMWLVGQKPDVKAAVAGYFKDPGVFDYEHSTSMMPSAGTPGVKPNGSSTNLAAEQRALGEAASRIKAELLKASSLAGLRDQIEFTLTAEGLRIELIDRAGSSFFDSGHSVLRGESVSVLGVIAEEIGKLTNDVVIEGHTDSMKYSTGATYGNWELSVDRANAARRVMETRGVRAGQVRAVRGFADTQLHVETDPTDPRNRRVSIVVRSHASTSLDKAVRAGGDGVAADAAEKAPITVPAPTVQKRN